MVSTAKTYMLKLVSKLKTKKLLKLELVDMKENNSILMRLEMRRMAQNKQKSKNFHCGPSLESLMSDFAFPFH